MLDLGIVILNWNTRELLRECLKSVFASRGLGAYCVVVVDNASTDGSAAMVRAEFPQALLVESRENNGYAAGNNLGLRALGFVDNPHPNPLPQGAGAGPHPQPLSQRESEVGPHPQPLSQRERGVGPHPNPLPQGESAPPLPTGERRFAYAGG